MKAITLWQPWASLLACGAKEFETRSWETNYRGPIAIHASQKPFNTCTWPDRELYLFAEALHLPDIYSFYTLPYGCVVATAELVVCHEIVKDGFGRIHAGKQINHINQITDYGKLIKGNELLFGDWTPGRFAWEFKNMTMLQKPIPVKGKQGLWNWEGAA